MSNILTFPPRDAVFEPEATKAMAVAFENVCHALKVPDCADRERAVIAERIIELARVGERDPNSICQRVLKEAGMDEMDRRFS